MKTPFEKSLDLKEQAIQKDLGKTYKLLNLDYAFGKLKHLKRKLKRLIK